MADERLGDGVIAVQVAVDEKANPKGGVTVSLVGYASDNSVSVVQAKTDSTGTATFKKLDVTGSVAYYALAQLARPKAGADRLVSEAIIMGGGTGMRVRLYPDARTGNAAIDDVVTRQHSAGAAVAAGTVQVILSGVADAGTAIEILDAATQKTIAKDTTDKDGKASITVAARAGLVVYAEAASRLGRYRSLPVQIVADRGVEAAVHVLPRVLPMYGFRAVADDDALVVIEVVQLRNESWIPYAGASLPLPAGATNVETDDDWGLGPGARTLERARALPPGDTKVSASFDVPAKSGRVTWHLDLPLGMWNSDFYVEAESGLGLSKLPAGATPDKATVGTTQFDGFKDLVLTPNHAMELEVRLPKASKATAVLHACRRLRPDSTPMVGKPLPDAALRGLDGKQATLTALRGKKPMLLNVMATWDMLSANERPTLATLHGKLAGKVSIVMVSSDSDAGEVQATIGKLPVAVLLDPPPGDGSIGPFTRSLGISALPENLIVDRKGIVRFHFQNARDWSKPEAARCLEALAKE
jgi:hypothetical protein